MKRVRAVLAATTLVLALVVGTGCASGGGAAPEPRAERPQPAETVEPQPAIQPEPAPEPSAPEPPPAAPTAEEQPTGAYGPRTVVIDDPQDEADDKPTLAEAARLAKQKREQGGGEPIAVITDETLPEYATGELSIAMEQPAKEKPATDTEATPEEEEKGEQYWRDRVRQARLEWRDLLEEITRLEGEVGELRNRFYAEDDGFYRDSQIKPAWDRALDRLAEARDQVGVARRNLEEILHEGRLAGAMPGWLREGIEYEPVADEHTDELPEHEVTEPRVIDDGDGGR